MNNHWIHLPLYFCLFLTFGTTCFGVEKTTQKTRISKKQKKQHKTHKHHKHQKEESLKDQPSQEPNTNQNNQEETTVEPTKHEHYIRVLLAEYEPQESRSLTFKAKDGFVLESPAHSNITALFQEKELVLTLKDGSFFIKCQDGKNRRIKRNDVEICAPNNEISLNHQGYQGSIHICHDKNTGSILVINKLELEDYLYSVIRNEGVPSWPHEMQKVQAIACRTFALYRMKQSRIKNPYCPYDLTNNFYCQVYKGSHESTHLRKAVEETRNMVLTYKGNIVEAMFDICCGGIISKNLRLRDVTKPYLYRTEPCKYCKNAAYYAWQEKFNKNALLDRLRNNSKCNDKLQSFGSTLIDIAVTDKDKAGVVHKITCTGKRTKVTLTGSEVRGALGLKSLAFSPKKDGHHFVINGHGNHHFKGLCQWGAKTLVDQGWNFKEILQYYYPNTKISYLK